MVSPMRPDGSVEGLVEYRSGEGTPHLLRATLSPERSDGRNVWTDIGPGHFTIGTTIRAETYREAARRLRDSLNALLGES